MILYNRNNSSCDEVRFRDYVQVCGVQTQGEKSHFHPNSGTFLTLFSSVGKPYI